MGNKESRPKQQNPTDSNAELRVIENLLLTAGNSHALTRDFLQSSDQRAWASTVWPGAEKNYKKAIEKLKTLILSSDTPDHSLLKTHRDALTNLADLYQLLGKVSEANEYRKEAIKSCGVELKDIQGSQNGTAPKSSANMTCGFSARVPTSDSPSANNNIQSESLSSVSDVSAVRPI